MPVGNFRRNWTVRITQLDAMTMGRLMADLCAAYGKPFGAAAQAGFGVAVTEPAARTRQVAVTVQAKAGPVEIKVNQQAAAKELGIKNRRWLNKAELDEAINLATEKRDDGKKPGRLLELEQLGRERCRAAWDAWKAKKEQAK